MTMRVSMIAPLPPYRGGISQFSARSWEALVDAGHEVQGMSFSRQYPGLLFPGKSQFDDEAPATPGPVLREIDSIGPWTWKRAAQQIIDFNPDLLFFQHWMPFFAPAFGSILRLTRRRLPDVKTISLIHNAIPHERSPLDNRLTRWFLGKNDGFVVLSESVERDLWMLGLRQPVRRIHMPIFDQFGPPVSRAAARDALGIADDTPLVLFFGYVRPYKGLDVLLEAVAEAREQIHELRLIVAGEFYEGEQKYRDLVARLGIARAVNMRNEFLSDADVATLFSACDVVAQPYITATQSAVAQVAFHFEKPLIITDVGGLPEVVQDGHAGLVVPARDSGALAGAIQRFFNEHLGPELTEGVRARKPEFSWDRLVEAVEDLAADGS